MASRENEQEILYETRKVVGMWFAHLHAFGQTFSSNDNLILGNLIHYINYFVSDRIDP